jgi:transmembrane sensor
MGVSAAVALLVLLIGGSVLYRSHTPASEASASGRLYVTHAGQRAKIQLADGSSVILGPMSRLQLAADFGATSRALTLDGQGLFTVARDGGVPFVVTAGGIAARVLGTTFAVRRYPQDSAVRVVVASGKVALADRVLSAGDRGDATRTHVALSHDVNIATAFAWADGALIFDRTPLRMAIPELERWYGLQITIADAALANRAITTTLSSERPHEALALCAAAINAHVTVSGSHAVFTLR